MNNPGQMFAAAKTAYEAKRLERVRMLVSVSDKCTIADFVQRVQEILPTEVVATPGTALHLTEAGLEVTSVVEMTGHSQLFDGRIKMIHLPVFAAILAEQNNPTHMRQLEQLGAEPFNMVVVNLYPFQETAERQESSLGDVIESIDIGGPAALRAAAKNFQSVIVVCDPKDYSCLIEALEEHGDLSFVQRKDLAQKAFELTRSHDRMIIDFFSTWRSR